MHPFHLLPLLLVPLAWPTFPASQAGPHPAPSIEAEAPALQRVVVLGASASDGFGLAVDLAAAFSATLRAPHEELLDLADGMFFTRPRRTAVQQVERALEHGPSLVLGVDFLFWMAYGHMPEAARPELLEEGLGLLARFECPVVVATLPDMSAAIGGMLSAGQVPSSETLARLNARIRAWAGEREAVVVDLATLVARLEQGRPFDVAGTTWPPSRDVALLLPDRLHPSGAGLAALTTIVAQGLVEREVVPAAALEVDVAAAHRRIRELELADLERRRAEREARRGGR